MNFLCSPVYAPTLLFPLQTIGHIYVVSSIRMYFSLGEALATSNKMYISPNPPHLDISIDDFLGD